MREEAWGFPTFQGTTLQEPPFQEPPRVQLWQTLEPALEGFYGDFITNLMLTAWVGKALSF
jgi:hypothetical protein